MMRAGCCVLTALALVLGIAPGSVEAQEPSTEIVVGAPPEEIVTSDGVPAASYESSPGSGLSGRAFDPGSLSDRIVNDPAPPVPADARDPLDVHRESGQESVIGSDDRTQVTDTTSYPNSAIGQLVFDQGGDPYVCSGFLIDQNTVLTSGHCVGDSASDWSTNMVFTPGRNGAVAPFGSCAASTLGTVTGWWESRDEYYDYGWVHLDCTIGRTVGWLGYEAFSDAEVAARPTTVRGYPGDKPMGTMWTDEDSITALESNMLYYENDTYGGMSGSPVYDTDADCGGPCAMAVHAYGTHGSPPHSTNNHGPRLTETRVALLAQAAASNDPPDTEPPTVQITTPQDGSTVTQGEILQADYTCTEDPWESGVTSCAGPVPDGTPIDTSTLGVHSFAVTGEDNAGNSTTTTHTYTVVRTIMQITAGGSHTCVMLDDGTVKCWGDGSYLGYGNTDDIGDDETPASVGPVDLGPSRTATRISAGSSHTCAVLDDGNARCWGDGQYGQLGYGNTDFIGDDETPASVGPVDLGPSRTATRISAGSSHTCALLDDGTVKCWGDGWMGRLGYGNEDDIGDDETPASVGPVDLGPGRTATQIAAGGGHTCALLDDGTVRCWGRASEGQLGYPGNPWIGDDETPGSVGPVDLGPDRTAKEITAGFRHTCAVLDNDTVKCWGEATEGQLGYGNTSGIINPGSVGPVDLGPGRTAVQISAGDYHTCAELDDGNVRCWGWGDSGRLGYGNTDSIGDDETAGSVGPVDLGSGRTSVQIAAGGGHTCAILDDETVRCWGWGDHGRLGYGNTESIGDDETPGSVGPVNLGPDETDPTIDLVAPPDGATYLANETVQADYSCADEVDGSGIDTCVGTVADGDPIDTSTSGQHNFTVTATDRVGNTDAVTHSYTVCPGHPFTDVPDWVDDAVDWAYCNEYMDGYPGNLFKPDNNMTRAQVANLLYGVEGSPAPGIGCLGLTDVPAWAEDAICWLVNEGYATGYPDHTFGPNDPISRAQVTRMLFRVEGSPSGSPANTFTDVPAWVTEAVDWITDPARTPPYATGYPDNTYRPDYDISRGQITRMTCRIDGTATC